MKILKKQNKAKLTLCAGAAALAALAPQAHAQSSDALIDKLEAKGILTADEAKDLRAESDKDFKTALQTKTGMPDWVTGWKIYGDMRGRFDQQSATDNNNFVNRQRERYRLRFGITASILDNMEVGFRLTSDDNAQGTAGTGQGNPLSGNSTFQNNADKKGIFIDAAYAKWTAINSGDWLLAATIGKMDNPFNFTYMVFDPDYTPEGGAITGGYTINDQQAIAFTGAAFVLDEVGSSTQDPFLYGGQILLNSKWTDKLSSSIGFGALQIVSPQQLTTVNVPYQNQGNTRRLIPASAPANYVLAYNYNPIIADASVTYKLESFPLYPGEFPVKVGGEYMYNPGVGQDNVGYWVGATLGKSGHKGTWDISYRYEYLEADAWYDQLVDDDMVAFYQNANAANNVTIGAFGGTNVKGHLVKFNYSITDYLTLTLTGYLTSLVSQHVTGVAEPNSEVAHVMADLMWKF
jgi:hypothetical protein